jgi:BlaI family transcriptional regulator, penicillinase repressor
MPKPSTPKPTDAELAILRVLWERGPCTVRQVYEVLAEGRSLAYTTTLKVLQIMTEKRLVTREPLGLQHVYRSRYSEDDTQGQLVQDLLDRAFGGSMSKLVLHALSTRKASPAELKAIRRVLAGAREKKDE